MSDEEFLLTPTLTPEGRQVRTQVFITEQGFQEEYDQIDQTALHLLCRKAGEPAAAGRLFPKEGEPGVYLIGRVAVQKKWRGCGLGSRLMAFLEEAARARGGRWIELHAQVQARPFYEKQGYQPWGGVFYEEGCPHLTMRKSLTAPHTPSEGAPTV